MTLGAFGFGRRPLFPALAPLFVRGKGQSRLIFLSPNIDPHFQHGRCACVGLVHKARDALVFGECATRADATACAVTSPCRC
jgi:hypothetical protein